MIERMAAAFPLKSLRYGITYYDAWWPVNEAVSHSVHEQASRRILATEERRTAAINLAVVNQIVYGEIADDRQGQ